MAVTRRGTEELAAELQALLNRPDQDTLISFPDDYYWALSKAHRWLRRKVAQHAPYILAEQTTVASTDGGSSYDLGDHHHGELEVWAPPGPPNGERIPPALPESPYFGFYQRGTVIYLTSDKDYSPGLYIVWTPETVADLDEGQDHSLPAYCEDCLIYRAAFMLASRPGFMGNPSMYMSLARDEWAGSPNDPSDMGIIGTLKNRDAGGGVESAIPMAGLPWYKRISGN